MNLRHTLLIAAACWIPSAAVPLLAEDAVAPAPKMTRTDWLPLPTLPSGIPVIPAAVNGTKGCLMIDSGAISSSIRIDLAEKLGVTLEKSGSSAIGIGGHTEKMKGGVEVKPLIAEDAGLPPISGTWGFLALPGGDGPPGVGELLGIVGIRELTKLGAVIDCGTTRILFGDDGGMSPPEGMLSIQMEAFKFGKDGSFIWAVPVKVGNAEGLMVVDTGAQHSVIESQFAERAGITLADSNVVTVGAGGAGGNMKKATLPGMTVARQVELGRMQIGAVDMPSFRKTGERHDDGSKPFAGIIGMDQLRRMKARVHAVSGQLDSMAKAFEPDLDSIFGPDPALVIQALIALSKGGDAEAKEILRQARENQGRITMEREHKVRVIRLALEKRLLKTDH